MKKLAIVLTALALTAATAPRAQAGDKEWATAGKILTGVFAGSVLTRALDNHHVHTHHTTTVYTSPAAYSTPVYVQQAPVVYQPAPVVVQAAPVYVQPAPVYYQPAPVYYQPAPQVIYHHAPPVVTYHHTHHRSYYGRPRAPFCW